MERSRGSSDLDVHFFKHVLFDKFLLDIDKWDLNFVDIKSYYTLSYLENFHLKLYFFSHVDKNLILKLLTRNETE